MSFVKQSTTISGDEPVFCPYCNKIQAKRGFIIMILQKDKYLLAKCWFCLEEFIIDETFAARKIDTA